MSKKSKDSKKKKGEHRSLELIVFATAIFDLFARIVELLNFLLK